MKGALSKQNVQPLRVYVVPEQVLAPLVSNRWQLFDHISNSRPSAGTKITIMGLVSSVSAATTVPYGLCFHCEHCKCVPGNGVV